VNQPTGTASIPLTSSSPWRQLSGYQWLVLFVAWLGWVFDSMDATIYTLVMTPALKELLGTRASAENIDWYGGLIFALFIVGWALGGVIFGILADDLGRARTLVLTILIYAIFTGLAAGTAMTKEYVQTVGRLAYVWGWPLVNSHNRHDRKSFYER